MLMNIFVIINITTLSHLILSALKTFFLILIFFCFKSGKNKEKNDLASWSAFVKSLDRTYPKGWPKWPSKLFILLVLIDFVFIGHNHCLAFFYIFCWCRNKTKINFVVVWTTKKPCYRCRNKTKSYFFHLNICLTTKLSPSGGPVCQKKWAKQFSLHFKPFLDEYVRVISLISLCLQFTVDFESVDNMLCIWGEGGCPG